MATINVRGYGGRQAQKLIESKHLHTSGRVHLVCNIPPMNRTVWLGPEGWKQADVQSGWEVTGRPHAIGMTTWPGAPPQEGDLNILWINDDGVEQYIQETIDVCRGTAKADPGVLFIDGLPGFPTDRWVIGSISFGDHMIRDRSMKRIRQDMTLHLIEYLPPTYETLRKGALSQARPKTVIYKVKRGDTPAKIARGRRCKWTDIRGLNRKGVIKTANQKLKAGIQIMVPVLTPKTKPKKKTK